VTLTLPRWLQAVLIPVGVILAVVLFRFASHAFFVFLVATLVALLLNPLVQGARRLKIPRAVSVPVVYLSFLAMVIVLLLVGIPPLVRQASALLRRAPEFADSVDRFVAELQGWLVARSIDVDLQVLITRTGDWLSSESLKSAGTLFSVGKGVATSIATIFLIVFVSFYMLIDGRRLHHYLVRLLPGDEATTEAYLAGVQASFSRYVKGQVLVGASVGIASGFGVWVLGWEVVGIWPEGAQYALLFGVWAGVTELIPYIGPWLGGAPPAILALFHSPMAALWVLLVYLAVQQLENHILVPNIMGTTVGVHPLWVIFAVLVGAQAAGIVGMLVVLPLVAIISHTIAFYDLRLSRAPWLGDDQAPPVRGLRDRPAAVPAAGPEEAQNVPSAPRQEPAPSGETARRTAQDASGIRRPPY